MCLKLTILGCGSSAGTPAIGGFWGKCDPNEPKNRRRRACVLVQSAKTNIVIDTGADFREQMNDMGIMQLDAAILTHAHGDHVHGIDDLRAYRLRTDKLVPVYGNRATIDELKDRFQYLFIEQPNTPYPQIAQEYVIENDILGTEISINDITFTPFEQDHGTCKSLGFRFKNLAYSTDMLDLDENAFNTLNGIDTWIIDGAGYHMEKNIVHCTLNEVYRLNEIVKAQRVIVTNLTPGMDYKTLCEELPDGYEPAYDGMVIDI